MSATLPQASADSLQHVGVRRPLISWAFLGLLLAADQLLLPMFHAGAVPYKVSYAICGLWLIDRLAFGGAADPQGSADFRSFSRAIGLIIACGLVGELWLWANYPVAEYGQAVRSVLIYVLVILSFGLGLSARRFRLQWLVPILFAALALNFGFILLRAAMPGWIVDLYYTDLHVGAFIEFGVNDVRGLLEMARPRGLFGNPNVSGLLVNIISLFIHIGLRYRLLRVPSPVVGVAMVALPIPLMIALASRGEFVVSCVLALLNYRLIFQRSGPSRRVWLVVLTSLLPIVAALALVRVLGADTLEQNVERALSVLNVVNKLSEGNDEEQASSIARPLLMLRAMSDRFSFSPLFGAGFSSTAGPPFADQTDHFHNDWFRMLATSGLIGLAAMLWILWRFSVPFGWVALIPFVLPAMVNTFVLVLPAMMFYFFMIGVLRQQLRAAGVALT
jgi:O-Antigen ligase